jgi:TonB-linked SusC/RagA family outer membrane protein
MDTFRRRAARACAQLCVLALIPSALSAQQQRGSVTGLVTDQSNGLPLASVQVFVAGTQLGGLTDQRGRYLIPNVPAGQREIRATILGYGQASQTVTIAAGGTATADFTLAQTAVELGGIVVNAITGEQVRRRELGNSVGNIDMSNVEKAAITRPADILTARVTGVEIRNINGTTGTGQKIRIRGANSISLSNEPLIIVDGVRYDNGTDFMDSGFSEGSPDQVPNRLNDLNPDDIESIEVLKGPAASGVYGTAASNGVILITTKRGSAGPTRWNFYVEGGLVQERNEYPDNLVALRRNTDGTFSHCRNYQVASGACAQDTIMRFNPFEEEDFSPFRDGDRRKFGLSASGGGDQVTYFISGDLEKEDGIYTSNFLEKYNVRANLRALMRDNLTFNVSSSFTSSDFSQPSNDNSVLSPILNGMFGRARFDRPTPNRAYYSFNPEVTAEQYFATQEVDRAIGSINGSWQPFSWLNVNSTAGIDVFSLHDSQLLEPNVAPIAATWVNGWAEESRATSYGYTANMAGTATFRLSDAIVSTTTTGADYNRQKLGATRAKGFGVTPGTSSLDGTASLFQIDEDNTEVITVGGFVAQQLALNDRVFVTAALRADDNSAFGQDFGLIYYPSATASWVISDESFFPRSAVLSSLRLRGAMGESGQRPQFRQAETYFSPATAATPTGDQPGVTIGGTGNLDLKPERTMEMEAGFDAGLLNERVSAEFTVFRRTTRDALIARDLPPSLGQTNPATSTTSGTRFENIGEVRNQGLEVALNARLVDTRPVRWSMRVSGAKLDNEITDLGEGIDPIILDRGLQKHITGYTAGGFWQPRTIFDDANGDGRIDFDEYSVEDSTSFIGPSLPELTGALSTEVRLFDFLRVSALFEGRAGHYNHNNTEDFRCFFSAVTSDRGCVGFDDPAASLQDQAAALASVFGDPNTANVSSWYMVSKADFIKWRELAFTITPPQSLLDRLGRVSGLSLTVAGRNLKTWTDYIGLDPEINETGSASNFTQGEFGTQPAVRYWTARINVNF